jgi:hypothetical protein
MKASSAMREVPYDVCVETLALLARLPSGEVYHLVKRWEEVCPELFSAQPEPPSPNGQRSLDDARVG